MSTLQRIVETVTRMPDDLRARNWTPPSWWSQARLGIFIHWGIYSVPAFAPQGHDIAVTLEGGTEHPMAESPYAEWYANSLRFPDSSVGQHHQEHYGSAMYEDFRGTFERGLDSWDPEAWAASFAATGAGYVVLVSKHHDGYCLWPTEVPNPHMPGWHSERDIVGELAAAVRAQGMRFGLYYSGGYDWTFNATPIGRPSDMALAVPYAGYADYAAAHIDELVERYEPSVLWNDICWPAKSSHLYPVLQRYFAAVPDGVVNDRFMPLRDLSRIVRIPAVARTIDKAVAKGVESGGLIPPKPPFAQYRTPEFADLPDGLEEPWEMTRGLDHSFAYNAFSTDSDYLSRDDLIDSLTSTMRRGGNFLINVGPRGTDAAIPEEQQRRLDWMAEHHAASPWSAESGAE